MTGTQTTRLDRKKPAVPVDVAPEEGPPAGVRAHRPWWRSKRGIGVLIASIAVVVIAAVAVAFVAQANAKPVADPVAVTVPVALSDAKAPAGLKIGIVLTLGQDTVEGAEWATAAQGAEVAKYRLGLGGSKVDLVVEDDHGTSSGADDAIANLVKKKVSGIVVASSGAHVADAVHAAGKVGIPTLLPYSPLPEAAPQGVWSLAPSDTALASAMNKAIDRFSHTILLNVGGGAPSGLHVSETVQSQGSDLSSLAAEVATRTGADPTANGAYTGGQDQTPASEEANAPQADAVVVAGAPARMAELVAALQSRQVTVPILLTPGATSPTFAQTLAAKGGTVSSELRTFSANAGDSTALGRDNTARAMSAFLQALAQVAEDSDATNLTVDAPFSRVAPWADTRAHDAVLALVHAAAAAGSTDPSHVRDRLSSEKVGAGNGIAGPPLDFGNAGADDAAVRLLYATGQSLGLRPRAADALALAWFPEPAASH